MPPRTNDFQRMIAFLERQLAPTGATVTSSAMMDSTDGSSPREVDVLIEHTVGSHTIRIGLECRAHKRRQGVEWIESIIGKYEHLPIHKVVAVSKSGFTKSAENAALHRHIDTVSLDEAFRVKWPERVACLRVGLVMWNLHLDGAEINYHDGPKLDISGEELCNACIEDGQGRVLGTFTDDVRRLFLTFAREDVQKWAAQHAQEIIEQLPDGIWPLRLPYSATNRFLLTTSGVRRRIRDVILCVECSHRIETADLDYSRYFGSIVGSAELTPSGDPNRYSFAVLFSGAGQPAALNVHWESKS